MHYKSTGTAEIHFTKAYICDPDSVKITWVFVFSNSVDTRSAWENKLSSLQKDTALLSSYPHLSGILYKLPASSSLPRDTRRLFIISDTISSQKRCFLTHVVVAVQLWSNPSVCSYSIWHGGDFLRWVRSVSYNVRPRILQHTQRSERHGKMGRRIPRKGRNSYTRAKEFTGVTGSLCLDSFWVTFKNLSCGVQRSFCKFFVHSLSMLKR